MKTAKAKTIDARPIRHRVFVYGTLRQGQSNAYLLSQHGVTRWIPASLSGYHLLNAGASWPYCRPNANAEGPVVGEMVEVTSDALADLDRLEGVPHHYERHSVSILLGGTLLVPAWVYVAARDIQGEPIPGNDWVKAELTRALSEVETIPCELCGMDTAADDCDENGYCSSCVRVTTPKSLIPPPDRA